MLFDFSPEQPVSFWMHNTFISLDMIFIRTDGHILHIAENTEPMSDRLIPSGGPVRAVLEVIAGTARKLGIAPGDRVALMSHTRYEWTLVDYAVWTAGAVVVPIYETSSAEQAEWIMSNPAARAVIVENDTFEKMITDAHDRLPALEHVWLMHPGLDELAAGGTGVSEDNLAERARTAGAADLGEGQQP